MRYHSERSQYTQWRKLSIALLCCIGLLVGSSGLSFGKSSPTPAPVANFTLLPYDPSGVAKKTYFVINARPGETIEQQLRVTNTGNAAGTARLTPVDATTGQSGGVVYLSPGQKQHNVGPWITMSTQQVTIAPGGSEVVQFQVTVPANATAGEHVAGIVAQNMALQHTTSSSGGSNFQVAIQHLTIVPVEMQLPGPRIEQLLAKGLLVGGYGSKQTVNVNLQNTGNVMVKSQGTLQITDTNGVVLQKFAVSIDMFLPQTSISYAAYVKGTALGPGTYLASLILNYGTGRILNYATTFTVTQQQINQTFGVSPGLQTPWGSVSLPLWLTIVIIVAVIIVLLAIGQRIYMVFRRKATAARHPNRRAGDPGRRGGNSGQRAGDAGQRAGDAGQRAGDAGQRAGDAGQRAGNSGQQTGDAGLPQDIPRKKNEVA